MRLGILDIAAAVCVLIIAVLPSPARPIRAQYNSEQAALATRVAAAQADVARAPTDGAAAARLAELLVRNRQTDWAIRAALRPVSAPSPDRWRALLAASAAHADRLEIGLAYEWARKALAACDEDGADCPDYEKAKLAMYERALEAAHQSGADPRRNPKGMIDAVEKAFPLIRLGGKS